MSKKEKTVFVCSECGADSPAWTGRCTACGAWNSLKEFKNTSSKFSGNRQKSKNEITSIIEVEHDKNEKNAGRITTKIEELDRVLGGGLIKGMVVLLAGEPGVGKSTLLLALASSCNMKTLYVCGEESKDQVGLRAKRLNQKPQINNDLSLWEETDVDVICEKIKEKEYGLVMVDSIQMMSTRDVESGAGSMAQVRECGMRLTSAAKQSGTCLIIVGHITKEGAIAGPKILEHMVDTVLTLEGERFSNLRLLRTNKNRFGATDETGVFQMEEGGLKEVANPSEFLLHEPHETNKPHEKNPGRVITVAMEGTRPILVPIEALLVKTFLPVPRRVFSGLDFNRMQIVLAVLQKHLNLPLWQFDIYLSTAGGFKISEPGADLAAAVALFSAFKNQDYSQTVAFGELGLLGNVRGVSFQEKRIKEANRFGFKQILSSATLRRINEIK